MRCCSKDLQACSGHLIICGNTQYPLYLSLTFEKTNQSKSLNSYILSTVLIDLASRRSRSETEQLLLYLFLISKHTNWIPLKQSKLTTAIIDQAIRRSRIRQPSPTSSMQPLPGEEGLLVLVWLFEAYAFLISKLKLYLRISSSKA